MNSMDEVGIRIKKVRWKAGLSQTKFGKMVGFGRKTIARCECGDTAPSLLLIMRIAEKYSISANWLLFGDGNRELRQEPGISVDPDALLRRIRCSGDFTAIEKRYMEKLVEQARKPQNTVRYCGRCVHAWVTEDGAAIACSLGHECHFEEVTSNDA